MCDTGWRCDRLKEMFNELSPHSTAAVCINDPQWLNHEQEMTKLTLFSTPWFVEGWDLQQIDSSVHLSLMLVYLTMWKADDVWVWIILKRRESFHIQAMSLKSISYLNKANSCLTQHASYRPQAPCTLLYWLPALILWTKHSISLGAHADRCSLFHVCTGRTSGAGLPKAL